MNQQFDEILAGHSGVRKSEGPLPGTTAYVADGDRPEITLDLPEAINDRGTISFWFKNEKPFRSGPNAETDEDVILSVPEVFDFTVLRRREALGIRWKWSAVNAVDPGAAPFAGPCNWLPGLPGPAWIHVMLEWDKGGFINSYFNGTPGRLPDVRVPEWTAPPLKNLQVNLGGRAISGLKISTEPVDEEALKREVTPIYWGSLNALLGSLPVRNSKIDECKGGLLQEWPLAASDEVGDWVMEGLGVVGFDNGWMTLKSGDQKSDYGHFVYWVDRELPANFIAEWEMQMLDPIGLCIVFFCAKGRDGRDIFDDSLEKREGVFNRYHSGDLDNYHISYFANAPHEAGRITSNMRKNHGFYVVANGPPGIPPESKKVHTVSLMKRGARVELAVDQRVVIDFFDDGESYGPVLGAGRMAFRHMKWTAARYRRLKIYDCGGY